MKLIKDGKIYDLSTATLIATSDWYMYYGNCQRKLYRSVGGIFFETEVCQSTSPDYNHSERISNTLTLDKARHMFEYIQNGRKYGSNHHDNFGYKLHVEYKDIFELVEG